MKKYIGLGALAAMMIPAFVACDNTDVYELPTPYAIDWNAAADSATNALVKYFWNEKGYFNQKADYEGKVDNGNSWNYWPQAHAMDVIIDAYERTGKQEYKDMFGKWYDGIKTQNDGGNTGGYTNDYYDDEAWIATTMARLYKVTNEDKYLTVAKDLYADIWSGWNDLGGGGLSWRKSQPWSKNSCINGPGAVLALDLYEITKDENYLNQAKAIYEWTRDNLFVPGSGEVYDNLNAETSEVAAWHFSYNQATVMRAAQLLYGYTNQSYYLKDAQRACYYTISNGSFLEAANNLTKFENGSTPGANSDVALFRAVFYHYFYDMVKDQNLEKAWISKFKSCFNCSTEYLWRNGLDNRQLFVLFGPDWSKGPAAGETCYLNPMVSACAAIEMRAKLEGSGK